MREKSKQKSNILMKIITIVIFISAITAVISLAPNYIRKNTTNRMTIIINNNDVTESMKFEPYIGEYNVVYMATKDIANFFDQDIFYDNKYDQIITTSDTKVAVLPLEKNEIYINSSNTKIFGNATKKDEKFYLPFSELKDVYNIEVNYIESTNTLTIDSLDREQNKGNASNDISIKYKPTIFSKTLDKVKKGDSVIIIEKKDNGWYKVRTNNGIIGYTKDVTNIYEVREKLEDKKQIDGKISLVWDYYTRTVPNRTGTKIEGINVISPSFMELIKLGQGDIDVKIGTDGKNYINWAHSNNYKVWAMISNNGYQDTTSEILNDYKLREKLINSIINTVLQYDLDGINLDFENLKLADKDMLSRFIIELKPRLKEYGKVLSVDVTAPDGSENWSECYDRNTIGRVADYTVFMAYDEYGSSSTSAGTTAGADWVEVAIKKFIDREEVPADKIILGMPFYTRLWEESDSGVTSNVIYMKSVEKNIPEGTQKAWNEDLKQYYIEYEKNGKTYKMWIEDEESIKAKFDLMDNYKLAGAAYWQKDFESDSIWNIIKSKINN